MSKKLESKRTSLASRVMIFLQEGRVVFPELPTVLFLAWEHICLWEGCHFSAQGEKVQGIF